MFNANQIIAILETMGIDTLKIVNDHMVCRKTADDYEIDFLDRGQILTLAEAVARIEI